MPSDRRSCRRTSKRILPAAFAWTLLLVSTALFFAFPCVYLTKTYHLAIPIFEAVVTFFVLYNFTMATFMDAGVVPKSLPDERNKSHELQPMFFDLEIRSIPISLKWCVTCQFYRPPRCTHCGICDSCIEKFDHHCPWVNNCIGRRNYRYFFMFLIWLSIYMISIFVLCILFMYHHITTLKEVPTIVTIVIMVIIVVLIIPVLGLTVYHILLIVRGRTTNEQVTGKFYEHRNPYSKGCSRNIIRALCTTQYPSFKRYFNLEAAMLNETNNSTISHSQSYTSAANQASIFQTHDQRLSLDTSIPHASHSRDCEPSPPPYKANRSNMFLSLSDSSYSTNYHIRNHRAITPPVMSEGRRRNFNNSRRSLPPQHRFHSSSQYHVNDHTTSDPGNLKNLSFSVSNNHFTHSNMCNINLFNSVAALRPQESSELKHSINSISNSVADMPAFPSSRFINTSIDRSETCCLGNQTVEKLQEIAHKNAVSEAFNKRCGTLNSSCESTLHDSSHVSSVHLSPVAVIGNPCVECQRTSASPCSSLASMEQVTTNDLSRLPGRRPLSFVKAMEMSDTLEHMCSESSYLQNITSPYYQSRNVQRNDDHDADANTQEISYEIRV